MQTIMITTTIEVEDTVFDIGDIVDIKGYGRYVFIRVPRNKERYAFINLASGSVLTNTWKTRSTKNLYTTLTGLRDTIHWVCVGNLEDHQTNIPFTYGDKYW